MIWGIIYLKNHTSPASLMAWSTMVMALPMFIPELHNKAAARYSAAFLRATLYRFLSLAGGRSTTSLISFGALGDWQMKWKRFKLFLCDHSHCCRPQKFHKSFMYFWSEKQLPSLDLALRAHDGNPSPQLAQDWANTLPEDARGTRDSDQMQNAENNRPGNIQQWVTTKNVVGQIFHESGSRLHIKRRLTYEQLLFVHILKNESNVSEPGNFCFSFYQEIWGNHAEDQHTFSNSGSLHFGCPRAPEWRLPENADYTSTQESLKEELELELTSMALNWKSFHPLPPKACLEEVGLATGGLPKPVGDRGMLCSGTRCHSSTVWSYHESCCGFYYWNVFLVGTRPQNHIPIRKWSPAAAPELIVELVHGKSCKIEH